MSIPIPILHCPTKADRDRARLAFTNARLLCFGGRMDAPYNPETRALWERIHDPNTTYFRGCNKLSQGWQSDGTPEVEAMLIERRGTLVNSPAHFISYIRRHQASQS